MNQRQFPILRNGFIKSIPLAMIEGHECRAQTNHYQSLNRLAERGGLSACEAVAVLEDRKWTAMGTPEQNARFLAALVEAWELQAADMDNAPA